MLANLFLILQEKKNTVCIKLLLITYPIAITIMTESIFHYAKIMRSMSLYREQLIEHYFLPTKILLQVIKDKDAKDLETLLI